MQAKGCEAGHGASLSRLHPWHHQDHTTQDLPSAQQICTPHSLPQPGGWESFPATRKGQTFSGCLLLGGGLQSQDFDPSSQFQGVASCSLPF